MIESKTTLPTHNLLGTVQQFRDTLNDLTPFLDRLNCRLLPSGMHPLMNPRTETVLWPHDNYPIYQAYDRIFNCRSHGWANVQSVHLNLPFADENQFERLHAAVRLVLPIFPR